jgi:glycogen(starch) synthase
MKILMLGWEYPPHIAGGLGTACQGLTTALSKHDVSIHFIVPQLFGDEQATHMTLTDMEGVVASMSSPELSPVGSASFRSKKPEGSGGRITKESVAAFLKPYWSPQDFYQAVASIVKRNTSAFASGVHSNLDAIGKALLEGEVYGVDIASALVEPQSWIMSKVDRYGHDIFHEVERFTAHVVALAAHRSFDVIHAHDWMTFPAGVALSQITGKPLVVHVHSLEYDRSGVCINEQINQIERFGVERASRVISVSY